MRRLAKSWRGRLPPRRCAIWPGRVDASAGIKNSRMRMTLSDEILRIGPAQLQGALLAGIAHVRTRREMLNRINVFPVPDGDTGTNLLFTLNSVGQRLNRVPDERMS